MSDVIDEKKDQTQHAPGDDAEATRGSAQEPAKTPIYKRPIFWIVVTVVVVAAAIVGTLYYLHARQYASTNDAFVDAHIVRLSPQVSGQLTWVADVDNHHVPAGMLLARIEPSGTNAQLQQAQAGVAQAQAGIEQAQGRLIAAQAQVQQAEANARAPIAQAQKAAQDLARYENAVRLDPAAVSGAQLDQARAQARETAAQAAAARKQIDSARAEMLVAQRGVAAARAQRKSSEAQVRQVDVTVGDLAVTAPIAGQVVNRSVNVGSTVSPQSQLMAIIPDKIWITANFKETQITTMRRGQPVDIKIDAFPDIKFHGFVDSIQRGAGQAFALLPPQNATGNFVKVVQRVPVRIVFDKNGPDPLKYPIGPGMSVVPTVKVR
ncbi:MAG: secretion protein HlyD [Sphingomonas sp. 28-66-16]|nr:MAG: secretion protein HlyD [Sphingomonas sp. 28-66-16]